MNLVIAATIGLLLGSIPFGLILTRAAGLVRQADPALLASGDPSAFMDEAQVYLGQLHQAIAEGYFNG